MPSLCIVWLFEQRLRMKNMLDDRDNDIRAAFAEHQMRQAVINEQLHTTVPRYGAGREAA